MKTRTTNYTSDCDLTFSFCLTSSLNRILKVTRILFCTMYSSLLTSRIEFTHRKNFIHRDKFNDFLAKFRQPLLRPIFLSIDEELRDIKRFEQWPQKRIMLCPRSTTLTKMFSSNLKKMSTLKMFSPALNCSLKRPNLTMPVDASNHLICN